MPDDDRNIWDTLGGLVGSVLKPVIGEKRIPILKQAIGAGLIGGGTHGDPNAIASYWGTIDQIQQRKQLQELWHNLHPDQPMPPGLTMEQMQPQYVPFGDQLYTEQGGVFTPTTDVSGKPITKAGKRGPLVKIPGQPLYEQDPATGALRPVPDPATGKPIPVPLPIDPFARGKASAQGRIAGEEEAGKGGPPTITDKAGEVWFYPDGRTMEDVDGPALTTKEARKMGGRPVSQRVAADMSAGQQALVMLKNMADVIDRLQTNGKLLQAQGIDALWDRATKQWKGYTGDPDLAELQGYGSDMIIIARQLGEKGVRAIQAYEGMLGLLGTGRAPYTAIKNYLQSNLDTAIRAGVPKQVPGAYDNFPGATLMGADKKTPTPNATPAIKGTTSSGMGFSVEDVP